MNIFKDVKSAIEALIRKALPKLEINVISTLQDVLEEKGVESVDDFNLIEASWLEGHGLKDMQLKKIMKEFMNYGSTEKGKLDSPFTGFLFCFLFFLNL